MTISQQYSIFKESVFTFHNIPSISQEVTSYVQNLDIFIVLQKQKEELIESYVKLEL